LGPLAGVAVVLESRDGKFAGWNRGKAGSLSAPAVPDECWRPCARDGRARRPEEGIGIDIDCIFGDSGELFGGMVSVRS
jgi:hypothetical protein